MGKKDEAFAILDKGVTIFRNNYKNYIRLAEFYFELGDKNMALNYVSVACNSDKEGCIELLTGMTHLINDEQIRELLELKK